MKKYIAWIVQCQSPYCSFTSPMRRNTAFELNCELTATRKSGYPIFGGYLISLDVD